MNNRTKTKLIGVSAQVILLILAALANAYYYFCSLADDSYISIRYALNYVDHGSIFYNQHELETGLVQGFSNPGMLAIYWLLIKGTSDVMLALKVLGTLSLVAITLIVFNLCRHVGTGWKTALAAGLTVAISPILGVPASSGLETIFLCLFLTASFRLLVSQNNYLNLISAAGLAFCVSMRPEGIALFVLTLFAFVFLKKSVPAFSFNNSGAQQDEIETLFSRNKLLWLLVFVSLSSCYFFWQYNMYGSIFPNTASIKASGNDIIYGSTFADAAGTTASGNGILSFISPGRYKYLYDFATYNIPYGILGIAGVSIFLYHAWNRNIPAGIVLALAFSLPGFALAFIGRHDYFPNFRYIAPYFPIFVCFVAITIEKHVNPSRHRAAIGGVLFCVWLAGLVVDIRTDQVLNNKNVFSATVDRGHHPHAEGRPIWHRA